MGLAERSVIPAGTYGFERGEPGVVPVPITQVLPGESPRLKGEDKVHVLRLAAVESPLPPILVDRGTMRVIDGIHRLKAASLKGQKAIDVRFFDGSREDAFRKAVEANVEHGLPLTQADRTAAALRILRAQPTMSDRAIAKSTGLGPQVIAELRTSSDSLPRSDFRVGRDGKVRPLDGARGRLRAAELIREKPQAPLRQVARMAGVSPATALDVRRRLQRGEEPVPGQGNNIGVAAETPPDALPVRCSSLGGVAPTVTLEKLMRDPSLRQNELGRRLLRMFKENVLAAKDMTDIVASVPSHCIELIIQLSRHNSCMWEEFTQELSRRTQNVDPEQKI